VPYNLAYPFYESSCSCPQNIALSVGGANWTYAELREQVQPVARWLQSYSRSNSPRVGVLASRSLETYLGILGACWAGGTYIPLSPKYPEERLLQHFERIELDALVVDASGAALLTDRVLSRGPANVLLPGASSAERMLEDGTRVRLSGQDALPRFDAFDKPVEVSAEHTGYIIFTSGTTGIPKGVMIPVSAVAHFLEAMEAQYGMQQTDRIAGVTEITFDLSVFDIFATLQCGAALLVVPPTQMMAPSSFIQRENPTIVFTVPSIAANLQRMKLLAANSFPSLRYSFFAGEPLPVASAWSWKAAAPNSVVDNLFGPTEATVVCIGQRFHGPENATPKRGVVATGRAFPGMGAAIVDPVSLDFLADEQQGELLLCGPQLSSGYFGDPETTQKRYPTLAGNRWYRTGDLAYRDFAGVFHHLGRIDNQVKILGLRVELEEIEAHLREVYETDSVAAIAWPVEHGSASGIVAFISGRSGTDDSRLREQIKKRLPGYMVPSTIRHIEAIPLNANGKIDRKELAEIAAQGKSNGRK
jgi:D-alanine--poly(phosphoribitol) ligase subunit 1